MTEFTSTITETETFPIRAVYGLNDGYSGARPVDMIVTVTSAPRPTDTAGEVILNGTVITTWIGNYLTSKDLRYQIDFYPSPSNLAVYLADVFRALDPSVRVVAVTEDELTATVTFDE